MYVHNVCVRTSMCGSVEACHMHVRSRFSSPVMLILETELRSSRLALNSFTRLAILLARASFELENCISPHRLLVVPHTPCSRQLCQMCFPRAWHPGRGDLWKRGGGSLLLPSGGLALGCSCPSLGAQALGSGCRSGT